jgi:hypothetical protein
MPQVLLDGGSAIISYNLQRTEPGGSVWFNVIGSKANRTTNTQYELNNLYKRSGYRFRYRVENKVGYSDWSPEVYLTPAVAPSAPQQPVYVASSDS